MANKYGKMVGIYLEKTSDHENFHDRQTLPGHAHFIDGPRDVLGRKLDDEAKGYDMTLITHRVISQTKSATRELLAPGPVPGKCRGHLPLRRPAAGHPRTATR